MPPYPPESCPEGVSEQYYELGYPLVKWGEDYVGGSSSAPYINTPFVTKEIEGISFDARLSRG